MDNIPLKQYEGPDLLAHRKNKAVELILEFFDHCNLKCAFCWQDHDPRKPIHDITDHIEKAMGIMANFDNKHFDVCMMGGEVFNDELDDRMFEIYKDEILRLNEYAISIGKTCSYRMVTNLVFDNVARVTNLIDILRNKGLDIRLATSYDPTGRFNANTLAVWKRNIVNLKDYIVEVAFVLTRPTIQTLIKNKDPVFKWLYDQKFQLFFDYYSPYVNAETTTMVPSDKELLNALMFLIKQYPNTYPVKDWIERSENEITCRTSHIVLSDGTLGQCRICGIQSDDYETPINLYDKREMEENFITRNSCFSCEYFNRCGMGCFLLFDYNNRARLSACIYKIIFDYIIKEIEPEDNPRFISAKTIEPQTKTIPIYKEIKGRVKTAGGYIWRYK